MALLEVRNVKKVYTAKLGAVKVQALSDVNFSVEEGEYVAIMGESGSGKTTLLNILASLDKATSGQVLLRGKDLSEIRHRDICAFRREHLGFVFQDFNLLDTLTLKDNIYLPLVLAGVDHREMEKRLQPLAGRLAITEILEKYPYEVSGGQRQRAAVCRALITEPDIILADEPTGALDSRAAGKLLGLFGEVNREGQTILMVTHSVKEGDRFVMRQDKVRFSDYAEDYRLEIITAPEYERIENRTVDLQDNEVLLHCSGRDYGYDSVDFMGVKLQVKEELTSFFPYPKAADNTFGACYVMVVKDRQVQEQCVRAWAEANGVTEMETFLESDYRFIGIVLAGEDAQKNAFLGEFAQWCQSRPGFFDLTDNVEDRRNLGTMYGALLFIGILFGLIFFMCLILIMYYKQITEGYEDRNSFDIMQKVGMSDREIRGTVRRQILMVFGLPLAGAVMHTAAGMVMVKGLMGAVSFFRVDLLFWCTVGVIIVFMAVYGVSYTMTAKTYYRIVRHE